MEFPRSRVVTSFAWDGETIVYPPPAAGDDLAAIGPVSGYFASSGHQVHGDTYPMTWGDDGEIWTSSGDPHWGGKPDGLDVEKITGAPPNYRIARVHAMPEYKGNGGEGQKPTGMTSVRGVLYLAFQNLLGKKPPARGEKSQHGSDASIVSSWSRGRTWDPPFARLGAPMFPGSAFGGPAFVNFGPDNANARDEFVYAVSSDQWDNGSHLRLGRVRADRIHVAKAWEWIASVRGASPRWTGRLERAV
ncbi:MAG: hypothetical protein AAB368_01905, partial [bacterium]